MSSIYRLGNGTPQSDSQIPFFDTPNGRDAKASLNDFTAVLQELLTPMGGMVTQYAAPAASGFNVAVSPPVNGQSVFLLMTPVAGYAAGTITLPIQSSCIDGQEVLVFSTQTVTSLTIALNGATAALGAPVTLQPMGSFRLRYDAIAKSWYCISGTGSRTIINAAPASGNTIVLPDGSRDIQLWASPAANIAACTVTLPTDAGSFIGQRVWIGFSRNVTALTVNGATQIYNAPTTINAGDFFTMVKVAANTWARNQ